MGRHSAPVDDEDDSVVAAAPSISIGAATATATPAGRHARPGGSSSVPRPRRGAADVTSVAPDVTSTGPVARVPAEVPAELPVEKTMTITAVDARVAAETDSVAGPDTDVDVADLEPIRPGEPVEVPATGPRASTESHLSTEPDQSTESHQSAPGPRLVASTVDRLRRPRPQDSTASRPGAIVVTPDLTIVRRPDTAELPDTAAPPDAAALRDTAAPPDSGASTPDPASVATPDASRPVSDLAMVRSDSALLARCLAAALTPFLLYFVVMAVVDSSGREWLIWIWIPAIAAGVAVGAFLDHAHKRMGTDPERTPKISGS